MPKNAPIPVPDSSGLIAWLMANPDAAPMLVQFVNLLLSLKVSLIKAGISTQNQQQSLLISDEQIILSLSLFWPAGVQADNATTVGSAVVGTSATQTTPWGYSTQAQANAIVTNLNAIRADIIALNAKVNSILQGERAVQVLPGSPS